MVLLEIWNILDPKNENFWLNQMLCAQYWMNSSIISPHLEVCLFKFQNDECKSYVSKSKLRQTKNLQPQKIDRIRQRNLDFKNSISNRKKESSQSTSYIGPFKCNTKVNEFKWIQSPLSKLVLVWFCNFWLLNIWALLLQKFCNKENSWNHLL